MAQTKDEKKRIAIRDAVIADVVEHGLGNAPMSRIAKRARVSAGTIYIYYPNKDEMIQSIYLEIKTLLHESMLEAYASGTDTKERLRRMWFAMFETMLAKPAMFAFHEIIGAEKILTSEQQSSASAMAVDLRDRLLAGVDDGTLKAMPPECLASLFFAPAISLARRMLDAGQTDLQKGETLFEMIWIGMTR